MQPKTFYAMKYFAFFVYNKQRRKYHFTKKSISFCMVSIVITAVICPFLIDYIDRFLKLKMFSQSKKQVW